MVPQGSYLHNEQNPSCILLLPHLFGFVICQERAMGQSSLCNARKLNLILTKERSLIFKHTVACAQTLLLRGSGREKTLLLALSRAVVVKSALRLTYRRG